MPINKELTNELSLIASNYKRDLYKKKRREIIEKEIKEKQFLDKLNNLIESLESISNTFNEILVGQGLKLVLENHNSNEVKKRLLVEISLLQEDLNGNFEVNSQTFRLYLEGLHISNEIRFFEPKSYKFIEEENIEKYNESKIESLLKSFVSKSIEKSNSLSA